MSIKEMIQALYDKEIGGESNSNNIIIPRIYLSNYLNISSDKKNFIAGASTSSDEFKIDCESYNTVSIETCTASFTVTGETTDGVTADMTATSGSTFDISIYKYISFKPVCNNTIDGNYRTGENNTTTVEITNIVLS